MVVVGAGSAGCAFAARIAERPGGSVLLVDAGPDPGRTGRLTVATMAELSDASTLATAYDPAVSLGVGVDLVESVGPREAELRLGRVVGGSGAVNGAYFVRGRPSDFDRWAARGNPGWSAAEVQASFERLEHDLDLGDRPGHGDHGPVPVQREFAVSGITESFFAACAHLGHVEVEDLNGPAGAPDPTDATRRGAGRASGSDDDGNGAGGFGVVPRNVRGNERVGAAAAYLATPRATAGPLVIGDRPVLRVVFRAGRAVGIEVGGPDGPRIVEADEVVVSAGALGSAELLRRSGFGPTDDLRSAGIDVVDHVPGLGSATFDHPCIDLMYRPVPGVALRDTAFFQGALHLRSGVEILATRVPYGIATGRDPRDELLSLRVTLMRTNSRGRLWPDGSRPSYGSLATHEDRSLARDAVRAACAIAATPGFAPLVTEWLGPDERVLRSDVQLDEWIGSHLGTAFHLCGTAPMGPASEPGSVVDAELRMHGIEGLRVVDTSIVPEPLSRGPAATAIMIGEHAAAMFLRS